MKVNPNASKKDKKFTKVPTMGKKMVDTSHDPILRAIIKIMHEVGSELDLPILLLKILEQAQFLLNADRGGGIYLRDTGEERLKLVRGSGINHGRDGITVQSGEGVAGHVYQTSQPLIVNDYTHWKGHAAILIPNHPSAVLGVPLLLSDEVIGVLTLISDSRIRKFTGEDVKTAELFAAQAAIAIRNAQLYQQAQQEIAERRQIEASLRTSEERFRLGFENANIGMCLVDLQGRFLRVNRQMCAMFGYSEAEFEDLTVNDITHPDYLEISQNFIQGAGSGKIENTEFEKIYVHKQGHLVCGLVSSTLIRNDQSEPMYFITHVVDITERKKAEETLRVREQIALQMANSLRMVNEIGTKITSGLDMDRLLQALYEECQRIGETDHFYVSLYDEVTEMLSFPINYENRKRSPIPSRRNHTVSGLTEYILEHRQTLHIPNTFDLPPTSTFIRKPDDPTRSYIGVPLMIKERVIGVLSMQSNAPDAYSLEQIHTLELLAIQAAIAIHNSQLYEQAQREIAERKQAEEKLRTSESQLKDAQRIAHMGSWYRNISTGTLIWSDELYQIVGWNPALPPPSRAELMKIYTPESFALRESASARAVETGEPYDLELELVRPDGIQRNIRARGAPVRDSSGTVIALQGTVEDITERKQAEKNLRRQLTEIETLYENGLIINQLLSQKEIGQKTIELLREKMDWHHIVIRLFNSKNEKLELLAFTGYYDNSQKDVKEFENHLDRTISGVDDGLTGWSIKNSKTLNLGNLHANPLYKELVPGMQSGLYVPMIVNRQRVGVISIESENPNAFSDSDERLVTTLANQAAVALENARLFQIAEAELLERKRVEALLEEERNQLARHVEERTSDLSRTNADLARVMRVKDEFLASMSHELRTPLTGILGLSEVLRLKTYGDLSEKQSQLIKNIEESGRHLLELINDILDLSKIEAGMLESHFAPCSLKDICQASLQLTKGMAQHKKQQVHYSFPDEPATILADARHLKQILVNLLGNAIKFSPEGGELGLEVQLNKTEQNIQMTVWDKGIGIKAENMHKLFMPFTQIDSSLAREYSGTGLGLSLVYRLAELHNGGIAVESTFGEGSRFTLTLPWSPLDEIPPHPLQRQSIIETPVVTALSKNFITASILIADDNEISLEMFADYLESQNYRVIKTRSGPELLERSAEIHPAVMLVDIQMPGMDGLETIRRIRSHPDAIVAATPVIAVTALAMRGDREKCLKAGANEYLSKPVRLANLAAVIQNIIERKQ